MILSSKTTLVTFVNEFFLSSMTVVSGIGDNNTSIVGSIIFNARRISPRMVRIIVIVDNTETVLDSRFIDVLGSGEGEIMVRNSSDNQSLTCIGLETKYSDSSSSPPLQSSGSVAPPSEVFAGFY